MSVLSQATEGRAEGVRRVNVWPEEMRFIALLLLGDPSGCWLWNGVTKRGYGQFTRTRAKSPSAAHRWAYEHFVGPIPAGMEVHHKCRVRSCVNPEHLQVVTHKENCTLDFATEVCPRGHVKDGWNVRGHRRCLTCHREKTRERRAGLRAA